MSQHNMVNTHYIQFCPRTQDIWRLLLLRVSGPYLGPTVVIYRCSSQSTWHAPRFTIPPTAIPGATGYWNRHIFSESERELGCENN